MKFSMKKTALIGILAAGMLALLAACSTTTRVMVGQLRPPSNPALVKVYYTPPKHYAPIAIVSADSQGSFQLTAQGRVDVALARAKNEAASLGANGLLFQKLDEVGPSPNVGIATIDKSASNATSAFVGVSGGRLNKGLTAVAIFVTEE